MLNRNSWPSQAMALRTLFSFLFGMLVSRALPGSGATLLATAVCVYIAVQVLHRRAHDSVNLLGDKPQLTSDLVHASRKKAQQRRQQQKQQRRPQRRQRRQRQLQLSDADDSDVSSVDSEAVAVVFRSRSVTALSTLADVASPLPMHPEVPIQTKRAVSMQPRFVRTKAEPSPGFIAHEKSQPEVSGMLPFLVDRNEDDYLHQGGVRHHKELKLQVASDLHLEMLCDHRHLSEDDVEKMLDEMIVPSAPYLVLAGDIGCPGTERGEMFFRDFLVRQSKAFDTVFFVAGNHEYYSGVSGLTGTYLTAPEVHTLIKEMCASLPNVVFLDRKAALVHGVRIIGATLWTEIAPHEVDSVVRVVSDYRKVHLPVDPSKKFVTARTLTTKDVHAWHYYDRVFLEDQIKLARRHQQDVVVITHHCPSFNGTSHPCHAESTVQSAFSVDLESMMQPPIKAWIFGHTHYCVDKFIGGVRLVSNQKGYFFDSEEEYRSDFVLTI